MINTSGIKEKLRRAFKTDTSAKLLSLAIAVIVWFVISVSVYPTISKPVYNVPIRIDLSGTYADSNSLKAASVSAETATIFISGERKEIGTLNPDELSLTVNAENITEPNKYTLPLELVNETGKTFEVTKIEPSVITVDFEKIVTREFAVTAEIGKGITIAEGYMSKDPIIISDSTISVTGPENQIDSITDVKVTVSSDEPMTLTSSYEFTTGAIALYNNGVTISNTEGGLTFSKQSFTVQIPVYVRQTLPLDVSIVNAPKNFDTESFIKKLDLSATELDIAAPTDKIKDITSLNIGTINMREVDIGSTFTFDLENILPEGYENLSGLSSVTVTCPSDVIKKKVAIRGNNITIVNAPSQFKFELITSTLLPYFIGPADDINKMTSTDISCQVAVLDTDFNGKPGDYAMPVTFTISSSDDIWINAGSATLNVYVRATQVNDSGKRSDN